MKRQNLRTVSLIVVTFTYLLIGAAIFGYLESEHEVRQREALELIELIVKRKYNISEDDFTVLTTTVIKSVPHKAGIQWKFSGAFYFATTVVTTIGYGHSTPATMAGRSFCMIYALIGIPLGLVMFQSIGERLNTFVGWALKYGKRCVKAKNPDVTQTNLVMVVSVLSTILMTSMAAVFAQYERWDYFDALYYCFITLTTIGFGDYVALQKESALQSKPEYVILSLIFILFGLSVVSSAVNLLVLKFLTLNTEDERRDEQLRYTANLNSIQLEGDVITPTCQVSALANCKAQSLNHRRRDRRRFSAGGVSIRSLDEEVDDEDVTRGVVNGDINNETTKYQDPSNDHDHEECEGYYDNDDDDDDDDDEEQRFLRGNLYPAKIEDEDDVQMDEHGVSWNPARERCFHELCASGARNHIRPEVDKTEETRRIIMNSLSNKCQICQNVKVRSDSSRHSRAVSSATGGIRNHHHHHQIRHNHHQHHRQQQFQQGQMINSPESSATGSSSNPLTSGETQQTQRLTEFHQPTSRSNNNNNSPSALTLQKHCQRPMLGHKQHQHYHNNRNQLAVIEPQKQLLPQTKISPRSSCSCSLISDVRMAAANKQQRATVCLCPHCLLDMASTGNDNNNNNSKSDLNQLTTGRPSSGASSIRRTGSRQQVVLDRGAEVTMSKPHATPSDSYPVPSSTRLQLSHEQAAGNKQQQQGVSTAAPATPASSKKLNHSPTSNSSSKSSLSRLSTSAASSSSDSSPFSSLLSSRHNSVSNLYNKRQNSAAKKKTGSGQQDDRPSRAKLVCKCCCSHSECIQQAFQDSAQRQERQRMQQKQQEQPSDQQQQQQHISKWAPEEASSSTSLRISRSPQKQQLQQQQTQPSQAPNLAGGDIRSNKKTTTRSQQEMDRATDHRTEIFSIRVEPEVRSSPASSIHSTGDKITKTTSKLQQQENNEKEDKK